MVVAVVSAAILPVAVCVAVAAEHNPQLLLEKSLAAVVFSMDSYSWQW